jgi:predicted nucleotidyltransferase
MAKVNLHRDFRELLESLNSAGAKYLVLGGYAVIFYGYQRVTKDLDLWISTDSANAQKVAQTLQQFAGFTKQQANPSMFRTKGKVFVVGREPVRVDILTNASSLNFDECYARREVVEWDGIKVPLISFEDLRANKTASGRAKDLADLENLPSALSRGSGRRGNRGGKRKPT